jgi:hypothetical protein
LSITTPSTRATTDSRIKIKILDKQAARMLVGWRSRMAGSAPAATALSLSVKLSGRGLDASFIADCTGTEAAYNTPSTTKQIRPRSSTFMNKCKAKRRFRLLPSASEVFIMG